MQFEFFGSRLLETHSDGHALQGSALLPSASFCCAVWAEGLSSRGRLGTRVFQKASTDSCMTTGVSWDFLEPFLQDLLEISRSSLRARCCHSMQPCSRRQTRFVCPLGVVYISHPSCGSACFLVLCLPWRAKRTKQRSLDRTRTQIQCIGHDSGQNLTPFRTPQGLPSSWEYFLSASSRRLLRPNNSVTLSKCPPYGFNLTQVWLFRKTTPRAGPAGRCGGNARPIPGKV